MHDSATFVGGGQEVSAFGDEESDNVVLSGVEGQMKRGPALVKPGIGIHPFLEEGVDGGNVTSNDGLLELGDALLVLFELIIPFTEGGCR